MIRFRRRRGLCVIRSGCCEDFVTRSSSTYIYYLHGCRSFFPTNGYRCVFSTRCRPRRFFSNTGCTRIHTPTDQLTLTHSLSLCNRTYTNMFNMSSFIVFIFAIIAGPFEPHRFCSILIQCGRTNTYFVIENIPSFGWFYVWYCWYYICI